MVVAHFLKWISTARVSERVDAASALARAFVNNELAFEDRCAAEAALTLLLDDPSSKVRQALAETLSMSAHAPVQIIAALASDQPEVAAMVLARSPLLTEGDLVERVASSPAATQQLIARRPQVTAKVSAAIADAGDVEACVALLQNSGADVMDGDFRKIVARHGHLPQAREAMINDARLPPDCRHLLLVKLGEVLRASPLVSSLIGAPRAERVVREACAKATLTVIDGTRQNEHTALVDHLRQRGDLTSSFLIRTIAHGKIDFFGSALVALTDHAEPRVRALLASGHDVAVSALLRSAGLAPATHRVILTALKIWREVARGKRLAGAQEVTWLMLAELGGKAAQGDLAGLIKSIHLDALRENARGHARAIAAA